MPPDLTQRKSPPKDCSFYRTRGKNGTLKNGAVKEENLGIQ